MTRAEVLVAGAERWLPPAPQRRDGAGRLGAQTGLRPALRDQRLRAALPPGAGNYRRPHPPRRQEGRDEARPLPPELPSPDLDACRAPLFDHCLTTV